ncbi:MAG: hypothetical protein ABR606_01260 [Vicinamibacterales bacterium]
MAPPRLRTWLERALADYRAFVQQQTRAQAVLVVFGTVLVASGLAHVAVWLAAGLPSLEGPVTWRKPIVFGVSTGVLTWSLAWIIGWLPATRALGRSVRLYVILMSAEIALIDMQQWRGVASHFNATTALDGIIFSAMGALILGVAAIIAGWTVALFRRPGVVPAALSAARAAMVFLNAGNLLGIFLAVWGGSQLAAGQVPNVFGGAGQLKIPHAVALHAVQVLPLIAWLLVISPAAEHERRRAVGHATFGYGGVLAFTLLQTFGGRAPLDVTVLSTAVLVVGSALLAWPLLVALRAGRTAPDSAAGASV